MKLHYLAIATLVSMTLLTSCKTTNNYPYDDSRMTSDFDTQEPPYPMPPGYNGYYNNSTQSAPTSAANPEDNTRAAPSTNSVKSSFGT